MVPGAGFEPATSGHRAFGPSCSPDYESGALARLGYPGTLSEAEAYVVRVLQVFSVVFPLFVVVDLSFRKQYSSALIDLKDCC